MDTRINFFKIGMFIVISTILLLATVFWLGKYGFEQNKFDKYRIYFKESISGLNIGSPIKFKGYEVGNVDEIKINSDNSEEIELNVLIKKGIPIKEDSYAILGNLGITGLKYVELKGGTNDSKILVQNKNGITIIPSKQSFLVSLEDSTKDITKELGLILTQFKKVLNDENINNLSKILVNTKNSMANIEDMSLYLNKKQNSLDELLKNINSFVETSTSSFENVNDSASSVKSSALEFQKLSQKVLEAMENGSFDLKELSQESFDKLNIVLDSLEDRLEESQKLIDNLNQSPSDLIFKHRNIKYGPGENDE